MNEGPRFVHRIDGDDGITFVNRDWLDFAAANDASHLTEKTVLGRCLWEFISDETTVHLYQALAKQVRDTLVAVEVPYRCDAPGTTRGMRMKISPRLDNGLEFASVIETLVDREPVQILSALIFRTEEHLRMCSWCKAVHTEDGWQATEKAVDTLGLFRTPRLPAITHAICESCRGQLERDILRL